VSFIHINRPRVTAKKIWRGTCLDCGKPTRFLSFHQDWYGWNSTCIRCGRVWDDGEWIVLPFVRGAREKSVASAKCRWRTC
jgi:hypothetical protein